MLKLNHSHCIVKACRFGRNMLPWLGMLIHAAPTVVPAVSHLSVSSLDFAQQAAKAYRPQNLQVGCPAGTGTGLPSCSAKHWCLHARPSHEGHNLKMLYSPL